MAGESDDLEKLFESVADGESVDWDKLERNAPDEDTRALIRQLRLIAEVAEVHRSQVDEVAPSDVELTAPAFGGLPPIQPSDARRVLPDLSTTPSGAALPGGNRPPGRLPPGAVLPGESEPESNYGTWGHLLLVRKIGEGSYGEVYHAHDTWLDHPVALKLLKPEVEKRLPAAQLLHEARKLARVRHPNVVTVHGADRHNGRVGFWMDFIDGETLATRVQGGSLNAGEASNVGQEICKALAAVHRANLIHRDVKAQNVMRAFDGGRIILMDFGAGQFVDAPFENPGQGTPLYLAPEILDGRDATPRSDIYACGVLLFYLVTNRFPVNGTSLQELREAHVRGERRRLRDERPDLPDSFVTIVERAIDPDPLRRYASAGDMEAKLNGETGPVFVGPRAYPQSKSVEKWSRVPLAVWVTVATLLFFTVAGAITSMLYYAALGISGPFRTESPLAWPVWGIRALLAPLLLAGGGTAVAFVILRVLLQPVAGRFEHLIRPIRDLSTATTASLLLLVQCALLALTWWWFGDLLNGFDRLIAKTAGDLTPLSSANAEYQKLFRQILSVEMIVMAAAWLKLYRTRLKRKESGGWLSMTGGIVATFMTVFLVVLPYRILLPQSTHARVVYRSQTCYLVGQAGNEGLLFCPLQRPPRNQVVRLDDPNLERGGPEESVFTPLEPSVN